MEAMTYRKYFYCRRSRLTVSAAGMLKDWLGSPEDYSASKRPLSHMGHTNHLFTVRRNKSTKYLGFLFKIGFCLGAK